MIIRLDELNIRKNKDELRYIRGIVYKITNIKNNKSYIAITTRSLVDAISNKASLGNKELNKDIETYLPNNFIVEILDQNKSADELNKLKAEYILKYNTNQEEFGYNKRVINEKLERELTITKEVAQKKLNLIGRQFNIDTWEGTAKPVEISCKFCGVSDIYSNGNSIFMDDSRFFKFRECKFCGNLYNEVVEPINIATVEHILNIKADGKLNYNILKWDKDDKRAIISCKKCSNEKIVEKDFVVTKLIKINCNNCMAIKYKEEREIRDKLYSKKNKYREMHKKVLDNKKYRSNIKNKIEELDKKVADADFKINRNIETINYINNNFDNALKKSEEIIKKFIGQEDLIGRTDFNEELISMIDPKRYFINSNKLVDEFIIGSICEYKTEKIKSKIFYRFIKEKENYPKDQLKQVISECQKWIDIYNNNLLKYNESYRIYLEKLKELDIYEEVVQVKKYEFTGDETSIEYDTTVKYGNYTRKQKKVVTLKQIRRICDGTIGGWIQSESNLSHLGDCFIFDDAIVFEDAKISGNAVVLNNSRVYGNSEIKENAFVASHAEISGNSIISGRAKVYGNSKISDNVLVIDNAIIDENAKISGDAVICEYAKVSENAKITDKAIICEDVLINGNNIIKDYTLVSNERIIK